MKYVKAFLLFISLVLFVLTSCWSLGTKESNSSNALKESTKVQNEKDSKAVNTSGFVVSHCFIRDV